MVHEQRKGTRLTWRKTLPQSGQLRASPARARTRLFHEASSSSSTRPVSPQGKLDSGLRRNDGISICTTFRETRVEKVIYLVWRDARTDIETFGKKLRGDLAAQLRAIPCVRSLQVNVVDAAVAAGEGLKQTNSNPPLETVVQVWVDSAITHLRAPVDAVIAPPR